jgi:hypothetical protein
MTKTYILNGIPNNFEDELFDKYREIERNFRERRWEPSELNGGKLCEAAYSILAGYVAGSFPPKPSKPKNFPMACDALEKAPPTFSKSIRILIPKILKGLYDIRNSRSVGHIGGDVDPNHMDAVCVLHMSKWVVAEIIRIFHGVSVDEATQIVEVLSNREIALVWDTGKINRVLDISLTMLEKTLVLLYGSITPLAEKSLVESLEHSNATVYRRDILKKAHKARLLEYSQSDGTVVISPLGSRRVEQTILPKAVV